MDALKLITSKPVVPPLALLDGCAEADHIRHDAAPCSPRTSRWLQKMRHYAIPASSASPTST
eukprot:9735947-Karenia_brevis.AAC.1